MSESVNDAVVNMVIIIAPACMTHLSKFGLYYNHKASPQIFELRNLSTTKTD